MDLFDRIASFFSSPLFRLMTHLSLLFLVVLWLSIASWTYRDAKKRGALALYWTTISLLFPVAGWFIYMILRPPEYIDDVRDRELDIKAKEAMLQNSDLLCPSCRKGIDKDFLVCPHCRRRLKRSCPHCEKPIKIGWTVCPYCQQTLTV